MVSAVQYLSPPTTKDRFFDWVGTLCVPEPLAARSLEEFANFVRLLATREDSRATISLSSICMTDAAPDRGRAVGGIGDFHYMVEAKAIVENPSNQDYMPVATIVCLVPVANRFGSRIGMSDILQRTAAEGRCGEVQSRLERELRTSLPPNEKIIYRS
jgi:hypothetical protein